MALNNDELTTQDLRSKDGENPLLRFDAMMAGVKAGGLRSISAINLLVCYIVANLSGRVKAETITTAMEEGELANYFEVADAIARLKNSKLIIENPDGTLTLGDTKGAPIELIEKDLPLTVREQSIKICQKILAKEDFARENKTEIVATDKGFDVVLHVSDKDTDFMRLTLFAATREQAEVIGEKFISNPVAVYETLIDGIFSND